MKRIFQIVITVSTDNQENIEELLKVKNDILSGQLQKEFKKSFQDAAKVTFTELTK